MSGYTLSLDGQVAIITGGRSGIGKATALTFARAGADVAICGRVVGGELEAAAEEIKSLGKRASAIQCDVRDKTAVNKMVEKVTSELGPVDILANCAGELTINPLVDLPEEDWDLVLDTNLKGTYLCCQAVAKRMIQRREGKIVNIGSIDGFNPVPYQTAYNCSKTSIHMLTSILGFELAKYNIRVNAVAPGWTKTPMTEYLEHSPEEKTTVLAEIAMGRVAEPQEIANVALFLVSDLASYVCGSTWRVDGAVNPGSLAALPETIPGKPQE